MQGHSVRARIHDYILSYCWKVKEMANTKSAAKNARKANRRHARRVAVKSELRTLRKKALDAAKEGQSTDLVKGLATSAIKNFAKAASNGYIHHRTASRKIGRLMRQLSKLEKTEKIEKK